MQSKKQGFASVDIGGGTAGGQRRIIQVAAEERSCPTGFGAKITQEICPEKFASISSGFRTGGHSSYQSQPSQTLVVYFFLNRFTF